MRVNIPSTRWLPFRQQLLVTRSSCHRYAAPVNIPGAVQMAEIVSFLDATLENDAILTNGAGNYSGFLHRFYKFKKYGTQLAPTSGSMGYGETSFWAHKDYQGVDNSCQTVFDFVDVGTNI